MHVQYIINMDYTEIQSKNVNISNITADASDEGESESSLEFEIQMENAKEFLNPTENIDIINLYEALDDKNKTIIDLKKRILNQQIQLAYYLHKNFCQENILEYANCVPIHEGLGIAIDTYIDNKDVNMHKLNCLHDKLQEYDTRVRNVIQQQEELVKNISENTIKESYTQVENKHQGDELKYSESVMRAASLDMCSRIMNATVQVKSELERLRQYAAKVIQLEAERNVLISYVLSMRKHQEQQERNLEVSEQEFRQILENSKKDEASLKTRSSVKSNNSECTLGKLFESDTKNSIGVRLRDAINTIETKTESLVSLTEQQRSVYAGELERLKKENDTLSSVITKVDSNNTFEIKELEEKCNSIADDLDDIKNGLETELDEKNKQINYLEEKVKESTVQSLELEEQILDLKQSVDAICAENSVLNQIINDILIKKSNGSKDIELGDIIETQREQIKNLMLIICSLNPDSINPNKKQTSFKPGKLTNEELKDSGVVSCSETESKVCLTPVYNRCQNELNMNSQEMQEDTTDNEERETETDAQDISREPSQTYINETNNAQPLNTPETQSNSKQSSFRIRDSPHSPSPKYNMNNQFTDNQTIRRNRKNTYPPLASIDNLQTSFLVEACNLEGKKESMKATLESTSNVEGILEMTSSSKLHLRLQYNSPNRSTNSVITLHTPKITKSKMELDEIDQQLNQIKNEAQHSVDKRNVIENIRSIYSQLFGGNTDSG